MSNTNHDAEIQRILADVSIKVDQAIQRLQNLTTLYRSIASDIAAALPKQHDEQVHDVVFGLDGCHDCDEHDAE